MKPIEITHFCHYLQMRNYSPHTIENYGRDLRLCFAWAGTSPRAVRGRRWTTSFSTNIVWH